MAKNFLFLWFLPVVILGFGLANAELKLVSVIFRHGDRMPDPGTTGSLTIGGKRRAYDFGKFLLKRYNAFLSDGYDPATISARSSDFVRTKMSLQLVLAALFPPKGKQKWNMELNWQPIPTWYVPVADDVLLAPEDCDRRVRERKKIESSPEFKKKMENFRELMDDLSAVMGDQFDNSLFGMFILYHTFMSWEALGIPIPDWASVIYPDGKLLEALYLQYELYSYNTTLRRLNGGTLVRKITDDMVALTKDRLGRKKLFLYGGHELNIAAVLRTLNLWKNHVPQYTSAIVFELHQERNRYYVKTLYYKGIPMEIEEQKIPGCDVMCPLEKYLTLMADVMPSDEEMVCQEIPSKPAQSHASISKGFLNVFASHLVQFVTTFAAELLRYFQHLTNYSIFSF